MIKSIDICERFFGVKMDEKSTQKMNKVIGVIAHVDAGKTTLSEAILYQTSAIRIRGQVDEKNTVMDSDAMEKERGITIFSSIAHFDYKGNSYTLLDTPGHVDFQAETERTFSVLDGCILVISGLDGVQSHTKTLFRLLSLYQIPTFVFVTKMDYARRKEEEILADLRANFGDGLISFAHGIEDSFEEISTLSEDALNEYLSEGTLTDAEISELILARELFPVYFGSGMTGDGVETLLDGIHRYLKISSYDKNLRARVFKITHDENHKPLIHVKILGGKIVPKQSIFIHGQEQKVQEIRVFTGEKCKQVDCAMPGDICALTGLFDCKVGDEIGSKEAFAENVLKPVMRYTIGLEDGVDPIKVLPYFRELEQEDPALLVSWNGYLGKIEVGLMGDVQGEILTRILKDRFHLSIHLENGHVLYKETILSPVEGVGHYEPLRHYAEVHLLLEPLKRGSGIQFAADCSVDELAQNWQNLILTNLKEKEHLGVLTGSPITDVKITVKAGRAHIKHTEGGDFRQATYRAVRQGLMQAKSTLLEPYYRFRAEVPSELLSRLMNDLRALSCTFLPPVYMGELSYLSGRGPVTALNTYPKEIASYSSGRGQIIFEPDGYDVCHNMEEVLPYFHYDPLLDASNPPSSVFCSHGAGFIVDWFDVPKYMHVESIFSVKKEEMVPIAAPKKAASSTLSSGTVSKERLLNEELEAIMLREFGPIKRPKYADQTPVLVTGSQKTPAAKKELLIIDGYNVIFDWDDLRTLSELDIQAAREKLIEIVSNFSAFKDQETVLIFDGYRVPGNLGEEKERNGILVVYTKERETADLYIEKLISHLKKDKKPKLVTSDGMIQLSALRNGIIRISSAEFEEIVNEANEEIRQIIKEEQRK